MLLFLTLSYITASIAATIAGRNGVGVDSISHILPRVDEPESPLLNSGCFNPLGRAEGVSVYDCPHAVQLKEDGTCPIHWNEDDKPKCAGYCEIRTYYSYGQEQPFDTTRCGTGPCRLTADHKAEVSKTFSFGAGNGFGELAKAFNIAASWAWTESKSVATGIQMEKPEKRKEECGYWTFVPYYVTSCGTMTEGDYSVNVVGDRSCHNIKTTQNFCQTTVWKNKNGNAGGVALFVAIDCDKGTPLGFCKQDPVYLKPGVARDPSVNANFVDAHFDKDPSKAILGTATAACERNQWPPA